MTYDAGTPGTVGWRARDKGFADVALYAVTIRYVDDVELVNATRPVHRAYCESLLADGSLHESGPYVDGGKALLVYDAPDRAALDAILANDPYAQQGCLAETEVHEWNVVFSRV